MYEFEFEEDSPVYYDLWDYVSDYCENPIKIFAEDEFTPDWCPSARKPYYQMRGKPVTPEQALEIIAKTDYLFADSLRVDGHIGSGFLRMKYCNASAPHGWVHPSGAVGLNDFFVYKWARISEMAEDLTLLAGSFPYLDMFIGVSCWDEMPSERWAMCHDSLYKTYTHEYKYYKVNDFTDNIVLGIWLHDKTIEFVSSERAAKLYKEYDKLYADRPYEMFYPDYYKDYEPDTVNSEFIKKCFAVYGIDDPDKFIENWEQEQSTPYSKIKLGKDGSIVISYRRNDSNT